jgi:hypothetical protein
MRSCEAVEVDPRARAAFPDLPQVAPAGSFWLLGDGQVIRIGPGGLIDQVVRGGAPWFRSIAGDPCTSRQSPAQVASRG